MGKKKKVTQVTKTDPATQAQQTALYQYANQQARQGAPGADPYSQQAAEVYRLAAAGTLPLGVGALTGDRAAYAQLSNPYQQQVIAALQEQYAKQRQQNMADVGAQATSAGAFGGSRYGVALAQALAASNRDENTQMAGILQGGYNDTMGRAQQLANFGMGANDQIAGMGEYLRNIELQRRGYGADTVRQNMYQTGQTNTTEQKTNAMSTIGGLAATGLSLWPGAGGMLRKGLGMAGGMLGRARAPQGDFRQGGFSEGFNPPPSLFSSYNGLR